MDEQLQQREQEEVIDLMEIFHLLLRKIWVILLCLVIGAAAAFGGTKLLVTPQYTATASIYIFSESTSITSMADLQLGSSLTQDFIMLSKSRPVVERVIRQLDLEADYNTVVNSIAIENPAESHFLKISATNANPELAAEIANAMAEAVKEQVADVMGKDKPSTVEDAIVPTAPSSPNVRKNTALGGLLGGILAAGVIVLLYMLDDTIKNEEDVKKYLGVNTLAALPVEKKRKQGKRAA